MWNGRMLFAFCSPPLTSVQLHNSIVVSIVGPRGGLYRVHPLSEGVRGAELGVEGGQRSEARLNELFQTRF